MVLDPVRLAGEVIQMGAIRLNSQMEYVDELKLIVRPQHYTKMHSTVKRITGIDEKQLAAGLPFPQAMEKLRQWCGQEPWVFVTWGDDDRAMLLDNFRLHRMDTDWVPMAYNLQWIFNMQVSGEERQWSLQAAMEKLELTSELQAHDALNDARNTARICQALDMEKGMADYPAWVEAKLAKQRAKAQSKPAWLEKLEGYSNRRAATGDLRRRVLLCPECEGPTVQTSWVRQGDDRWMFMARCRQHGQWLVEAWMTQQPDGTIQVERKFIPATPELVAQYERKRSQMLRKRKKKAEKTIPQPAAT